MMREKVVSAKASCEEGFHLCFEGGDAVTDDGWGFPILGNPVALKKHFGDVMFWVICFASIEDVELHVAGEAD
eukprot:14127876-Ditylum_brightwellii.AAC.1